MTDSTTTQRHSRRHRTSRPLADLFPEYDEPIEPGSRSPSPALRGGGSGSGIGKKKQRAQEDWSDDELPEIDYELDGDMGNRVGKKKQRKPEDWSDDEMPEIDYVYDEDDASQKTGLRHKQSVRDTPKASASKESAAPSTRTRHHCILSGHIFRRERIPIRQDQRIGQRTRFDLEEKREKCEDCKKDVVENLWVCEIPVCGRRVCGTCKRGWDGEQARRAKDSWGR